MAPELDAPRVARFSSDSAGEAHDHLRDLYGLTRRAVFRASEDSVGCTTASLDLGDVSLTRIGYDADLYADNPAGLERPTVVTPHGGSMLRYDTVAASHPVDGDHSLMLPPGVGYQATLRRCDATIIQLDRTMIAQDAGLDSIHFVPGTVTGPAQLHWRAMTSMVNKLLQTTPAASLDTLLRREMLRALNTAAVSVFPHVGRDERPVGAATPASVRRAVAFINTQPDHPMTITEIADAARVSARSLQAGFRRHLGVTPLEYVREVRLDLAHRDLLDGDPVTTVAHRWGFTNVGRFARLYRTRFGNDPGKVAGQHRGT